MLKSELGVDAELIGGDKGIFDVKANGKMVFSKYEEDRFPDDEEIVTALRALA